MSAALAESPDNSGDYDDEDLLPDDLKPKPKGNAVPVVRSAKQQAAAIKRAEAQRVADDLRAQADAKKAQAARLAQIVNLHIAGHSLADIGASIGATEDEVDRMLAADTQRYVRNQPALRTYVRQYISGKYTELLDTVWDRATDDTHAENLDAQDRALRILDRMGRLHGAEAPLQKEVHIDAAPEAVEKLVNALSQSQGFGYDASVFDIVEAELVEDAVEESHAALEAASDAVEQDQEGDEPL